MNKSIVSIVTVVLGVMLQACGTSMYIPTQYTLRDGLIPAVNVSAPVNVVNEQKSDAPVIVYSYGGSKLQSDLKSITQTMVEQTMGELIKNSKMPTAGNMKTIGLKVNSLLSTYVVFSWKSDIEYQATLGNGKVVTKKVHHASGALIQDLNGCIAEGVLYLLNDPEVRSYLMQ